MRSLVIALAGSTGLTLSAQGDSLRCGTALVSTGDLALQAREKCGDPISEELIGYTLKPARYSGDGNQREFKIEQWIYGPEQGNYRVLTFEAGRLRAIENIRQ